MNQKSGLDPVFKDEKNPFILFNSWMKDAEKSEINDPNAFNLATVDTFGQPDNRILLLKGQTAKALFFIPTSKVKKEEI